MHVDAVTLADLELFSVHGESASAFAAIDCTVTDGGRDVLRGMLREPFTTAADIRERQRVLRALVPHLRALPLRELNVLIEHAQAYLRSPFVPLPRGSITRNLVRFRYQDMLETLTAGIAAVGDLLELARVVRTVLASLPPELSETTHLLARIRECDETPVLRDLVDTRRQSAGRLDTLGRYDAPIRGDGKTRERLHALISALHHVDALQSLATVSARSGWSFPEVVDSATPVVKIHGLVHPLLSDNPVPNDMQVFAPTRLVYITGPNMAGKTTLMKACGLSIVFAQVGMAIPAASATLSPFDRIVGALTVRDSVVRNESYFLAEVRRVKTLVTHVANGERIFAIVDEMFKGTNIADARDATVAVLLGLARAPNAVCLIASHITEIAVTLSDDPRISLACFDAEIMQGTLTFSHRMMPGVSHQRVGLQLLEREGVLQLLNTIPPTSTDP